MNDYRVGPTARSITTGATTVEEALTIIDTSVTNCHFVKFRNIVFVHINGFVTNATISVPSDFIPSVAIIIPGYIHQPSTGNDIIAMVEIKTTGIGTVYYKDTLRGAWVGITTGADWAFYGDGSYII